MNHKNGEKVHVQFFDSAGKYYDFYGEIEGKNISIIGPDHPFYYIKGCNYPVSYESINPVQDAPKGVLIQNIPLG